MNEEEKKEIIKEVKQNIGAGHYKEAFLKLKGISAPDDDFVKQAKYASLFKSIPEDALELKKIRVAILATSTISHFSDILKYWLAGEGFAAEVHESIYDTIEQTILDPNSSLYDFGPEVVMLFINHRDVKCDVPPGSSSEDIHNAVTRAVEHYTALWEILRKNSRVFGNYEGTALWGCLNVLRSFNLEIAKAVVPGVTIFDLDYISSAYGKKKWHEARYWYHSKHAFALDATGLVAYDASKVIGSIKSSSKKCIVLDLDNTIWGGVIGDDEIKGISLGDGPDGEAFMDFQKYLLKLKDRGVILTVCSKNDEDIAKEPFTRHPHMQLKLDDITVFRANWDDKISNIRQIAAALNIGLDSLVFIDDNPAERQLVRSALPMVSVPELPEDPSDYISCLSGHSYFETVLFSEEDRTRSEYYRSNTTRSEFQKHFTNLSDYLRSLCMEMTMRDFDDFNLPRIVQLINKSNQFHLTTTRYNTNEIKAAQAESNKYCRYFTLRDRFGDNGLISVIILQRQGKDEFFIDTWVMSCRVLSRGVEEFICEEIISLARKIGCKKIIGKYIPTKKNKLAERLYERLHFRKKEEKWDGTAFWELSLDGETLPSYSTFIRKAGIENGVDVSI